MREAADNLTEKLENNVREVTDNLTERLENNIEKVADTLKNVQNDEPIRLKNATEIAEFFNDPRGFIISKLESECNIKVLKKTGDDMLFSEGIKYLKKEDQEKVLDMLKKQRYFTQEQTDLIKEYSAYTGPVYAAYLRGEDMKFDKGMFSKQKDKIRIGTDEWTFKEYLKDVDKVTGVDIGDFSLSDRIKKMDKVIEESKPLEQSMIVSRNINGLSINDEYIENIDKLMKTEPGTVFKDKAFLSASADEGKAFLDRPFKMEIEIPAGSRVAYIQSEVASANNILQLKIQDTYGVDLDNNWLQQEVLIGRNKGYELKENVEWRKEILSKKQKDSIKSRLDKTERGKLKDIIKKRTGLSEKEIDKIVGNMELKLTEKEKKDAIKGIAYEQTDEIKAAIKSAQEGKIKKSLLHNGIRELSEKDIESIKLTKEEKLKIIKSVNYFNDEKKEFGHYIIKTKLKEDGIDNVVSNVKKAIQTYFDNAAKKDRLKGIKQVVLNVKKAIQTEKNLKYFDNAAKKNRLKDRLKGIKQVVSNAKKAIQTEENLKYFNNVAEKDRLKGIKQLDLSDIAKEMQEDGTLAKHIAELRDINNSKLYEGVSMPEHGIEHVESVLLSAMYIGKKEQITEKDMDLLVEAAKFHDCGRGTEGIMHGLEGANGAETYLKKNYSNEDLAKIKAAIEYHAIPDNQQDLENLLDKYHITKIDEREKTKKIANVLKDADALDRVRFPGNLDERYLRTDTSKEMVQALYQMHEIRGTEYLKSLDLTPEWKTTIEYLQEKGVSDYELAFWLKNKPKDGERAMGVWYTVNEKINNIVNGLN